MNYTAKVLLFSIFLSSLANISYCQAIVHNLGQLLEQKKLKTYNRALQPYSDKNRLGVQLDVKEGDGVAWLSDVIFQNGTIEVDVKGKDTPGQSFVGIAFHGTDDKTYEAIYFRPFNFKAADSARRNNAVQYISHPVHTWKKLRDEHFSKYENPVNPAPDPNDWFHVRIDVNNKTITVYVNDIATPVLEVTSLSENEKGAIGLWVGNFSGGEFANLSIKNK